MNMERFQLLSREVDTLPMDFGDAFVYRLGTGHRQLFHYDRYPRLTIVMDNASNCLAGCIALEKGIFVFHDPPLRVMYEDLPIADSAIGDGIIGGSRTHWEAVRDRYERRKGVQLFYVKKPEVIRDDTDYSFAFVIQMQTRTIDYGYYHNPKGLSGDGWIWE